jgi:hypothetical protein
VQQSAFSQINELKAIGQIASVRVNSSSPTFNRESPFAAHQFWIEDGHSFLVR